MLFCATRRVAGHILCVHIIPTYGIFCVYTTQDRGQKMLWLDISQAEGEEYISNKQVQVSYVDTPYNCVVCGWIMCVQFEFGYSWFLISECVFLHRNAKRNGKESSLIPKKTLPTECFSHYQSESNSCMLMRICHCVTLEVKGR